MPLREIGEFHEWIRRERPTARAISGARTFIAELGDEPWRSPSVPIPDLSNQPEYEVRVAALEVEGEPPVWARYLHAYATGNADLVAVSNR